MNTIATQTTAISNDVVWIDRNKKEHQIPDMQTRHLFYTLTMLWNNSMPVKTRTNYKRWTFTDDRFKDKQYIRAVIGKIWAELSHREDLELSWMQELAAIQAYWLNDIRKLRDAKLLEQQT